MPILIQDFALGNFPTRDGGWTDCAQSAVHFEDVGGAWNELDRLHLSGVRVVYRREETPAAKFSRMPALA